MADDIPAAYRSTSTHQALAHLIEELCEAGQAGAKGLRFGLSSVNPELETDDRESNLAWLRRELANVGRAVRALDRLAALDGLIAEGELVNDCVAAYLTERG